MYRYVLLVIGWVALPAALPAQSLTLKLHANPVLQIEEQVPLSAGASLEVGLTKRSAVQLNGNFRLSTYLDAEPDRGNKFYLDYRYYLLPRTQANSGWYVSPFAGYGRITLGRGDEPPPSAYTYSRRMVEREAGVLLGVQPFGNSRFAVDLFLGPMYQQRNFQRVEAGVIANEETYNRLWLRAGYSVSFRLFRSKL
jgi:hypothetical protein